MTSNCAPKAKKVCILIVDDEEEIRMPLERRLFGEGYDVETAANGKHAIQKLEAGKQFQLILCDLKMPLLKGHEFIASVRALGCQMPIIVMSGNPDRNWITSAAQSGISAVFLKPFRYQELIAKIKALAPPGKYEAEAAIESADIDPAKAA